MKLFLPLIALATCALSVSAQEVEAASPELRARIDAAVAAVKPALVRIHVVETYYSEGRELKFEASGSGAVIRPDGHIITNHHVAGHAKQLKVTFADKREYEAERIGTDPLTDIAVIKVVGAGDERFPVVNFGDSAQVQVGDFVLAMGSPLALSQSVTLGIVSNTEMIIPTWISRGGGLEQDGENVGALVRWIGHDAEIFGGNSGGPLANLNGDVIGINEISMGLGGAIPGNLARHVADALISEGKMKRAWFGLETQPRLKHDGSDRGVLVSGTLEGSPAAAAGLQPGDHVLRVGGQEIDVEFMEQMPDFNQLMADQSIGAPVELQVLRGGETLTVSVTPVEREEILPRQIESREWGLTLRNISNMMAKELKRDNSDGVLITSVRPGGPAGNAKPEIQANDILVRVDGKPVKNLEALAEITAALLDGATAPKAVLTEFERRNEQIVTVVEVGISDLTDPGREVKKAWLPVETQVITREIAQTMGQADLTGFRVTHVFKGSTAEQAGLKVGDLILALDGEPLTAARPEDYEELETLVRQYQVGVPAGLTVLREGTRQEISVELVRAPLLAREMKKVRVDDFDFTARDISFFDKAEQQWEEEQQGVMVEEVKSGGWGALGGLAVGDLLVRVNNEPVPDVDTLDAIMDRLGEEKPKAVTLKIRRGIHTMFIELEPKWDSLQSVKG